ncbi:hypothetical protein POVWA2_017120 [Plasmodium ovale wallikeri]|uniref:Uncharacterized protein n=1 Tax=Plasmodium ovale wallikeri TaxID=864142 RepID=A0A1A8YQQ7_PLAOA|nr:hypothetical protein POVWA1_017240 [Plasmodium ovale wallikeri]SBT33894.1 hypothetical protein POVWA2_017120 [Plasmodium ovale wallikeri]
MASGFKKKKKNKEESKEGKIFTTVYAKCEILQFKFRLYFKSRFAAFSEKLCKYHLARDSKRAKGKDGKERSTPSFKSTRLALSALLQKHRQLADKLDVAVKRSLH